jgi:hypothetical protein
MGTPSSVTEAIAFPGQDRLLGPLGETPALLHKVQFGGEELATSGVEALAHLAVDLQDGGLVQVDVLGMGVVGALAFGRPSAGGAQRLAVVGSDHHYLHRQTKAGDAAGLGFRLHRGTGFLDNLFQHWLQLTPSNHCGKPTTPTASPDPVDAPSLPSSLAVARPQCWLMGLGADSG